jgi:hypothetical protein
MGITASAPIDSLFIDEIESPIENIAPAATASSKSKQTIEQYDQPLFVEATETETLNVQPSPTAAKEPVSSPIPKKEMTQSKTTKANEQAKQSTKTIAKASETGTETPEEAIVEESSKIGQEKGDVEKQESTSDEQTFEVGKRGEKEIEWITESISFSRKFSPADPPQPPKRNASPEDEKKLRQYLVLKYLVDNNKD